MSCGPQAAGPAIGPRFGGQALRAGPRAGRTAHRRACQPRAIADLVKQVTGSNGSAVKIPGGNGSIPAQVQEKLHDMGATGEVDGKLAYRGVALSVRQRLIDAFNKTQKYWRCSSRLPCLWPGILLSSSGCLSQGQPGCRARGAGPSRRPRPAAQWLDAAIEGRYQARAPTVQ